MGLGQREVVAGECRVADRTRNPTGAAPNEPEPVISDPGIQAVAQDFPLTLEILMYVLVDAPGAIMTI